MILARRTVPFFAPIVLAGLFFGLFQNPQQWPWWSAGVFVVTVLSIGIMTQWDWRHGQFWLLLFPLLTLTAGGTTLLFFLDSFLYQVSFVVLLCALTGIYTEDVFIYFFQPQKYVSLSLVHLGFFLHLIGGFALFSSLFALHLINAFPLWLLPVAIAVWAGIVMLHTLCQYKIWQPRHVVVVLAVAILFAELAWVVHFWPTAFFVNGAILTVALYSVPSLFLMQLRNTVNRKAVIRYVAISVIACALIVWTSQWK